VFKKNVSYKLSVLEGFVRKLGNQKAFYYWYKDDEYRTYNTNTNYAK